MRTATVQANCNTQENVNEKNNRNYNVLKELTIDVWAATMAMQGFKAACTEHG